MLETIQKLREFFQPHFPDDGLIIFRHSKSPCPHSLSVSELPYQNGKQYHSLADLARAAAERLNHDPTINCHGCGLELKPIKAIGGDRSQQHLDTWLDHKKIPHRRHH